MLDANSLTLSLSSRELAQRAGVTPRTASKVLKRLRNMGLLTLVSKSEHAPHISTARKGLRANLYRLVTARDIKQRLADYLLEEPHAEPTISAEVLLNYAGHDAFRHRAKLLISGHNSLGPTALEVLAAIVAEAEKGTLDSGLSFAELGRRSNVSASTVAKKVRALENMGLVSLKKEGRCQIVRLLNLEGWEKQLESKRQLLKTNGRAEARKS
jgi:DNA-binding MarR family transcriptional regulator